MHRFPDLLREPRFQRLDIQLVLGQIIRLPFGPLCLKEITAIDMERCGQSGDRVQYGMHDVMAKRTNVPG